MRTPRLPPYVFRWPPLGVNRILDTRFWKHYLPQTSFAGGKKNSPSRLLLLSVNAPFRVKGHGKDSLQKQTFIVGNIVPCRANDVWRKSTITGDR